MGEFRACRDLFYQERLLALIVPDIQSLLDIAPQQDEEDTSWDMDAALPGGLWSPSGGAVSGGVNYGEEPELAPIGVADDSDDP